jgi:hypothetical protein
MMEDLLSPAIKNNSTSGGLLLETATVTFLSEVVEAD